MRRRNIRHTFDFCHIQNPQIGSPSFKEKELIMVGAQVLRQGPLTPNSVIEHEAERRAINFSGMHAKTDDSARVLIHDDQDPVSSQGPQEPESGL
jgi:hypothetical protein